MKVKEIAQVFNEYSDFLWYKTVNIYLVTELVFF